MVRIRCVGGPADGQVVDVDGKGGVATRLFYWIAVAEGRVRHADDPAALDLVPPSGWTTYRRLAKQPESGPPLYEAVIEPGTGEGLHLSGRTRDLSGRTREFVRGW